MEKYVFIQTNELVHQIVKEIKELIEKKPTALLCIAGGDTPKPVMEKLVEASQNDEIDFSTCYFVGLDEWVGISKETDGSCYQTLDDYFFSKLKGVKPANICFFNGKATALDQECERINQFINKRQQIDYILLGIGMNGHLGFNEPGAEITKEAHVIELDMTTKQVMGKYFKTALPLEHGITLGLKQILNSGKIVLMATGEHKASMIAKIMNSEPTNQIPATLMKMAGSAVTLYLDQGAAQNL